MDDGGKELDEMPEGVEDTRHCVARPGDHLMVPFQCETCHFRNIFAKDPNMRVTRHLRTLLKFRRCSLDAFWAFEPTTVKGNLSEAILVEGYADEVGFDSMGPPMGPFPLKDTLGMKAAVAMLMRSQEATGRHEKYVQPKTFGRARTAIANIHRSSASGGLGDRISSTKGASSYVSNCPTHTFWFGKFSRGISRRVGSVTKRDKPIMVPLLLGLLNQLKNKYDSATTNKGRLEAAQMGAWLSNGFCTALRGEEMLLIEQAGTRASMEHLEPGRHEHPYHLLTITGKTKNNRSCGASFQIPAAAKTKTGINPSEWQGLYLMELDKAGRTGGYLFGKEDGSKARLGDFEENFFSTLEEYAGSQENTTTKLISENIDIREEFGLWRSLRRGVTAHAINQGVDPLLIHQINRWRTEMNNQAGSTVLLDIYAELEALLPTALRYSLAL